MAMELRGKEECLWGRPRGKQRVSVASGGVFAYQTPTILCIPVQSTQANQLKITGSFLVGLEIQEWGSYGSSMPPQIQPGRSFWLAFSAGWPASIVLGTGRWLVLVR